MSLLLLLALMAGCPPAKAAECGSVEAMRWLLGDWQAISGEKTVYECWWPQPPDALEGVGRTMSADQLKLEERLRLEVRDGRLHYDADVSVNPDAVAFGLVTCDDSSWTFENPEHDFPQRILYRRTSDEAFIARVTDLDDQGFELSFQRLARIDD
jgi:hypothetical protein